MPALSNPVVKLTPLALCSDVDIDGTWFDVDEWTLRLVAVDKAFVADVVWFKWLGNCELFNEVDIRFVVGPPLLLPVTVDVEPVRCEDDCCACWPPIDDDWDSACMDNWHGDFGECEAFAGIGIEASADVDDDNGPDDVDANVIWLFSAMEDECNGFALDDYNSTQKQNK